MRRPVLWLLWPLAAFYGLVGGLPRTGWEWAQCTLIAFVACLPPALIGYRAAQTPRPDALRRGIPTKTR